MAVFVLALILALLIGFAAHRSSVCTVRGVAEIMSARTGFMLASIGKTMVWVLVIMVPMYWLGLHMGASISGWQLTGLAALGGLMFGIGAAVNGACAYSTMARLVDGEGSMLMAVVGFALGVGVFTALSGGGWLPRPAPSSALITTVLPWVAALWLILLLWGLYEAVRLWRSRSAGDGFASALFAPQYRLSSAAMLIGLAGAAILLLYGAPGYTSTFQLVIEALYGAGSPPSAGRWILLLAVLGGMLASTLQRGSFRFDYRPRRVWLRNIAGGALMGIGTALTPGGNDMLVLYGIPTLSPHALPAFLALLVGAVAGLWMMKAWFGMELRVTCRNDRFVQDTAAPQQSPAAS